MRTLKETEFTVAVIQWIQKIPKGKVATYGQIAALAGKPHGSRGVAWILHSSSKKYNLPWHRVLNSKGRISFPPTSSLFSKQKNRLRAEGVTFEDGRLEMKRVQWSKKARATGLRLFAASRIGR